MDDALPYSHPLRRTGLAQRKPTRFSLAPDAAESGRIAAALGITEVRNATFKGEIRPLGRTDFGLEAVLDAEVVQPCVSTLVPVVTRLHETVLRRYQADWQEPDAEECEMPEDDSLEPLGEVIDVGAVMVEAIALALPLYPHAPGAGPADVTVTAPGAEPLSNDRPKPFADLARLLKKADKDDAG